MDITKEISTKVFPFKEVSDAGINLNPQNFDFVYGFPFLENLPEVENFKLNNIVTKDKIGIYIHIPFCNKICNFCYFTKSTNCSQYSIDKYIENLQLEFSSYSFGLNKPKIEYCYIGGGTPSLLNIKQIDYLFKYLYKYFDLSECKEITFEGCPSSLSLEKIKHLKTNGVNRISIGIQSFDQNLSFTMNRNHTKNDSINCIKNLHKVFDNKFNADFIYGYPLSNLGILKKDLEIINNLFIPSITMYQLWSKVCKILYSKNDISFKDIFEQKKLINEFATSNNYIQDKSDWFIKSEESKFHFQDFKWMGGDFMGLGQSSYAYINGFYYLNEKNSNLYSERISKTGNSISRLKSLTNYEIDVRKLILGIKTFKEIKVKSSFLSEPRIKNLIDIGLLSSNNEMVFLSETGKLIPDNVSNYLSKL